MQKKGQGKQGLGKSGNEKKQTEKDSSTTALLLIWIIVIVGVVVVVEVGYIVTQKMTLPKIENSQRPKSEFEIDLEQKIIKMTLFKRPLANKLRSNSQSKELSKTVLKSDIANRLNIMHFLFIIELENGKAYKLELIDDGGYKLSINNEFELQLVYNLQLHSVLTLEQLQNDTKKTYIYDVLDYNCINFANDVLKKYDQKKSIKNPAYVIKIFRDLFHQIQKTMNWLEYEFA